MHPITRHPNLLLFITWLSFFARNCHADLNSEYATYNCIIYTAIGAAEVCCNGNCADGTTVDSPTGLCVNWLSPLYDPPTVPSCTSTQLWSFLTDINVTVGGTCASSGCQWESESYSYNCCECPAGYVSDTTDYEQSLSTEHYDLCFGCTDAGETLTYDPIAATYSCQVSTPTPTPTPTPSQLSPPLQELCSAAPGIEDSLTKFGNFDSWLGAMCPTTSLLSAVFSVLVDIYDLVNAIITPTGGVSGTEFTVASAVVKTISSFLLTAEFESEGITLAGITAAMGTVWETICAIVSYAGEAMGGVNFALGRLQKIECSSTSTNSRRSLSLGVSDLSSFEFSHADSRRDVGYNPCVVFLSYFPTDYTTAALADTSCDQINLYNASAFATEDATVAAAITGLQQFCSAYQGSGNSTMIMALQKMFSAIAAAVPYCNTTQPATSSSSSASGSLVTGTSSPSSSRTASLISTSASLSQISSLSSVPVESPCSSSISTQIPGSSSASTIASSITASLPQSTGMGSATTSASAPGISSFSPSGPASGKLADTNPISSSRAGNQSPGPSGMSATRTGNSTAGTQSQSSINHVTLTSLVWVTCMLIFITLVLY